MGSLDCLFKYCGISFICMGSLDCSFKYCGISFICMGSLDCLFKYWGVSFICMGSLDCLFKYWGVSFKLLKWRVLKLSPCFIPTWLLYVFVIFLLWIRLQVVFE